jgi:predicted permease
LLLRSIYSLRNIPLGFVPQNLIVAQLPLLQESYAGRDVIQTVYKPLLEELQHTPGVQYAGISSILPMSPDSKAQIPVEVFGRSENGEQASLAELRIVSPDIYRALGIRLLSGRSFADTDSRTSPWVVVVNQRFARKYFPNEDPLGKQIRTAGDGPHKYSAIVGVVEDTHQKSLDEPVEPEVDLCYVQLKPEDDFAGMLGFFVQVAVRADRPPATVIPEVRKLLQQINPEGAYSISTMQETVDKSLSSQTLVAQMVWLFAGAALLIAVIGLYGLLAYNVSMSTRDIAVRLALGATRSKVLSMVLKHALLVLVAGLVSGFMIWQQTANLLRNYLYGVGTHDFPTIFAVAGVLLACGLLAGYIPARRASLVDPMKSLRHE